jgi:acyl-CoA thioesterase
LNDDGHLPDPGLFKDAMIHVTLSMSTEIKKRLPEDGVRWLYTRTEAKKLEGSRIDMETLLFDEAMDLVAISHQAAWIVTGMEKTKKSSSL